MKSFKQYITEVENWDEQITSDDHGNQYQVKDLYDYAKNKCKDCYDKHLPIQDTDALYWWSKNYSIKNSKHAERMKKADTSVPVLGIRVTDSDKISIADGLNRIKKAHAIEKKKTIPAYILNMDDVKHLAIKSKKPNKS